MRTFTSAVLIVVFAISATVGLAAHVFAQLALNPERTNDLSGWVTENTLGRIGTDRVAERALDDLVPDPGLRRRLSSDLDTAQTPEVRDALTDLVATGSEIDVSEARGTLSRALAESGQPALAREVRQLDGRGGGTGSQAPQGERFDVRGELTRMVATAHDAVEAFALKAAVLAAVAAAAGIAVARSRRSVARGVANTVVFSLAGTIVLFVVLPWLVRETTDTGWLHTFGEGATVAGADLTVALIPIFVAGLLLRLVAPFIPQADGVHTSAVRGWLHTPGRSGRSYPETSGAGDVPSPSYGSQGLPAADPGAWPAADQPPSSTRTPPRMPWRR